jgi:superoxide dismutase, Cu-Zn family
MRRSRALSHRRRVPVVIAVSAAAVAIAALPGGRPASARTLVATAELKLASGEKVGTIRFENPTNGDPTVLVADFAFPVGTIQPGTYHGMHIHANDVGGNGSGCVADATKPSNSWFVSADGHFKRDPNEVHGGHAGDLPSIFINRDRTAHVEFRLDRFVAGELFDRAVIFHADPDNYGNIPKGTAATQYQANSADAITATNNTGNAGDRVACGVIDVKS